MENTIDRDPSSDALNILIAKLEEAKARNPRLSLRGFAQKIGISSGALSEILKGKRPLSNPVRKKIASKLMLSPEESLSFFKEDLPETMTKQGDDNVATNGFHSAPSWLDGGSASRFSTAGRMLKRF